MTPAPELHPWNRGFAWRTTSRQRRILDEAQARSFDERGFCVVEGAFPPEVVREVVAEIDPWEEKVESFLRGRPDGTLFIAKAGAITFTTHLVLRSAALRRFVAGPVFRDLAHDLVGPDVRLYWDQAVYKKPEPTRVFPWHQDNGYNFVEPQQYLTCWVALGDATERNGCPRVVPGLHRLGTLRHRMTELGWVCLDDPADAVAVPVRAGGIVVFSSLTPHCTGPNTTDGVRKSYIVQFAPEGARLVREDGGRRVEVPQDDAQRQFPVLRSGEPA
jgi:ectoine hydroxylase-related dioxygenase (phytanoyl-CoA dioxygenase family)